MNFLLFKRTENEANEGHRWKDFWTSSKTRKGSFYPYYTIALEYLSYNPIEEVDDTMWDDSVSGMSKRSFRLLKQII